MLAFSTDHIKEAFDKALKDKLIEIKNGGDFH
jgi:hypothetical protein